MDLDDLRAEGCVSRAELFDDAWRSGLPVPDPSVEQDTDTRLIALLAVDFARMDGNPVTVIRRELSSLVALVTRRSGRAGAAA